MKNVSPGNLLYLWVYTGCFKWKKCVDLVGDSNSVKTRRIRPKRSPLHSFTFQRTIWTLLATSSSLMATSERVSVSHIDPPANSLTTTLESLHFWCHVEGLERSSSSIAHPPCIGTQWGHQGIFWELHKHFYSEITENIQQKCHLEDRLPNNPSTAPPVGNLHHRLTGHFPSVAKGVKAFSLALRQIISCVPRNTKWLEIRTRRERDGFRLNFTIFSNQIFPAIACLRHYESSLNVLENDTCIELTLPLFRLGRP